MTKERARLINAAIAVAEDPSDAALSELYNAVMDWPFSDWPEVLLNQPVHSMSRRERKE